MSQRKSGYDRQQNEAYFTPSWVVDCLLDAYPGKFKTVYDPCCGDGQIVRALEARSRTAGGSDITDYGFKASTSDFLETEELPEGYRDIITNPPYGKGGKLAEDFISHALKLVTPRRGMVAMLLRSDFDSARGRLGLFGGSHDFAGEIKLLKRIQWTNIEHTASPSQNHTWFIWDTKHVPIRIPYKHYAHPDDAQSGVYE